jgi:hypothetical protein
LSWLESNENLLRMTSSWVTSWAVSSGCYNRRPRKHLTPTAMSVMRPET